LNGKARKLARKEKRAKRSGDVDAAKVFKRRRKRLGG
jgi:hypothetical protein